MKKIISYLSVILVISLMSSCSNEDYSGMNITKLEEEINIPEFVGDLTSQIVIKNAAGEVLTEVDMGEAFFIADNTQGGADVTNWTITQESTNTTITSEEQFERMFFKKSGDIVISLESTRSSDGETETSSVTLPVNWVPVTADFVTDPLPEGAVLNILTSHYVTFNATVSGAPEEFEWTIVGPNATYTSDEQSPTIRFLEVGTYDVTFTAKRDDTSAGGNLEEAVVSKPASIVVDQYVINRLSAVATDNKILLTFDKPIMQELPSNVADEFSVRIEDADGNLISNPEIFNIAIAGENSLEITFGDNMYVDDEVLLTFNSTGILMDATGLYTPESFTDEPCMYGNSLWNIELYNIVNGDEDWTNQGEPAIEISDEQAYNGKYSVKLISEAGSEWTEVVPGGDSDRLADLTIGTDYYISWKTYRESGSQNAYGNWLAWEGSQTQFWYSFAGYPGQEWFQIVREHTYNGADSGAWFWTRVKSANTIFVDDIRIAPLSAKRP